MIKPRSIKKVVPNEGILPPCWLRVNPTELLFEENLNNQLYCVGPNHEFHRKLINCIVSATNVILLSSFLLTDRDILDALLDAWKRKVRIYILTATENQINKIVREDDNFSQDMHKYHKEFLDKIAGKAILRTAKHFHAKFVVADPEIGGEGWLSTANFNKAVIDAVEIGLRLSADQIKSLHKWFSFVFWNEAKHELRGKGDLPEVKDKLAIPIVISIDSLHVTTKSSQYLKAEVLKLILNSKKQLLISSYGFENDHEVVNEIVKKAQAGITVTIFTRPRPIVGDAIQKFVEAGATVYAHDKLHAKAIISDGKGIVMTANIESKGLDSGFEVGASLSDENVNKLAELFSQWEKDFPWKFVNSLKLGDCGETDYILPSKSLREFSKIIDVKSVQLPDIELDDLRNWNDPPMPKLEYDGETIICNQIEYKWKVKPPMLPSKAEHHPKPDGRPYFPERFILENQFYIVAKNETDILHALKNAESIKGIVVTI